MRAISSFSASQYNYKRKETLKKHYLVNHQRSCKEMYFFLVAGSPSSYMLVGPGNEEGGWGDKRPLSKKNKFK